MKLLRILVYLVAGIAVAPFLIVGAALAWVGGRICDFANYVLHVTFPE